MEPKTCICPMRDGGHEWLCGKVGEYEYVHCKKCDKSVWMCEVSLSLCQECRRNDSRTGLTCPRCGGPGCYVCENPNAEVDENGNCDQYPGVGNYVPKGKNDLDSDIGGGG